MKAKLFWFLATLAASFSWASPALASSFPEKAVRIIVPYTPGDGPDVVARLIGNKLSERFGQPVVVENRAGASGQIGLSLAAQAPADGYTLAVGLVTNLALAPHAYKSLPYDPLKDFTPIALIATNYLALVTHPNAPFKTIGEMVEWARANPGKLTAGTTSVGGLPHMSLELLAHMADFKFVNVLYKGNAPIVSDLIAGRLDLGFGSYTSAAPHIEAGRLRLLGISSPERDPMLPDLPTMGEAVKGYGSMGWFAFVAPAGVPGDIVKKLNDEINRALQQPDVRKTMTTLGLAPAAESPEYLERLIKSEYEKFGNLVREIGFQPQ
jgi:tripartite-type tricarboxylate transporter receptor subunit TctC